jgi:hypothetical protein
MPPPQSTKAAFQTLSLFGIAPQRSVTLDVAHTLHTGVSDAELDALLARSLAGDDDARATMLALASGKPVPDSTPPPGAPLPPDFTSSQAGGRAGPGPESVESQDSDFGEPQDADYAVRDTAENPSGNGHRDDEIG